MPEAESSASIPTHIVIVGAMGSGKTTLASDLARQLGLDFHDSDLSIRRRTGRSGREIAEQDGVDALHRLERKVLFEALADPKSVVVAAAASVIEDSSVREALDDNYCIWVTASPQILAERSARGSHRREVNRSEHLEDRLPLFEQAADLVIDTGVLSESEAVAAVLEALSGDGAT